MAETVGIVIGTYGSGEWRDRGLELCKNTKRQQSGQVVLSHATTLSEARNMGAEMVWTDWLVFLDADDRLHEGYCEGVLAGSGDLRQPATVGIRDGVWEGEPNLIEPALCLLDRNHLVIGTAVRREIFVEVGGFRELPCIEDFDLWVRCWAAGAEIGTAPEAIYEVGLHDGGRNTNSPAHTQVYNQIQSEFAYMR